MERKKIPAPPYYFKLFRYGDEITSDIIVAQKWLKCAQEETQEPVVAYISKRDEQGHSSAVQLELDGLERDLLRSIITLTGSQIYPKTDQTKITLDVYPSQIIDANIYSFYIDGIYYDYMRNNSSGCLHDHVIDEDFISEKITRGSVVYGAGGYTQTAKIICMITPFAFQTINGEVYRIAR